MSRKLVTFVVLFIKEGKAMFIQPLKHIVSALLLVLLLGTIPISMSQNLFAQDSRPFQWIDCSNFDSFLVAPSNNTYYLVEENDEGNRVVVDLVVNGKQLSRDSKARERFLFSRSQDGRVRRSIARAARTFWEEVCPDAWEKVEEQCDVTGSVCFCPNDGTSSIDFLECANDLVIGCEALADNGCVWSQTEEGVVCTCPTN